MVKRFIEGMKTLDPDKISLPFRTITGPAVMLIGALLSVFLYIYHNDVQWIKENFNEIKVAQSKLSDKLDGEKDIETAYHERINERFEFVHTHCCSASKLTI